MPTKTYHELVRDRITEIIEADGKFVFAKRFLTGTTYPSWIRS